MIKKNVVKLYLIIITSLILPSTYILGNTNKSDVKIKVFKLNDKKEIPSNQSEIEIEIEDNETKEIILNGSIPSNYGLKKVSFAVFPWVRMCDYGESGVSVRVFSNDKLILQFKCNSGSCD